MSESVGALMVYKKYPQIRYVRQILFTFFDFMIALGGVGGLFLGISIKGILQFVHHFTINMIFWDRKKMN